MRAEAGARFAMTRSARPDLSRWAFSLPVEVLLALRFLREGPIQSTLVLAGVTAGVAVTVFLTQLSISCRV